MNAAHRDLLHAAVRALLDREVFYSRASLTAHGPAPDPTPDRPAWWDHMPAHHQDLAMAAEAVGIWTAPEGET